MMHLKEEWRGTREECFSYSVICRSLYMNNSIIYDLFIRRLMNGGLKALARHGFVLQKWSENNKCLSRAMEWNLVSCSGYRYERQPFVYLAPPTNLLQKHEKLGDEQITMALFQPWASARVLSYDLFFSTGYHHFHKQKSIYGNITRKYAKSQP